MSNAALQNLAASVVAAARADLARQAAGPVVDTQPDALVASLVAQQARYDDAGRQLSLVLDALNRSMPGRFYGVVTPGVAGSTVPVLALGIAGGITATLVDQDSGAPARYRVLVRGDKDPDCGGTADQVTANLARYIVRNPGSVA